MAKQFEDSEVHNLFKSCKDETMHHLALDDKKSRVLIDDNQLNSLDHEYLITQRSSYLTL